MGALAWRIYYGDGSTFDSSDGPPSSAPPLNCQCIVINDDLNCTYKEVYQIGKLVLHDWEYYVYRDGMGWFGVRHVIDLVDHVLHDANDICAVLKARSIDVHAFREIFARAVKDTDFPKKSAWTKGESDGRVFDEKVID